MPFLAGIEWTPKNILKYAGLGLALLLLASLVYSFVRTTMEGSGFGLMARDVSYSAQQASRGEMALSDAVYSRDALTPAIPAATAPYPNSYASGNTAEEYEVTEYSASVETRDKESVCGSIAQLKSRSYVIFENVNDSRRGCDYRFKVEKPRAAEILAFVRGLDPKDLNENTYTIKGIVDDYASQVEILTKKRQSLDDTLADAVDAYDDLAASASASGDTASLAKVIDSKIQLIERLTRERIDVNTQLDALARAKADQLDRLAYTYFNVSVYENTYLDGENLADSWKEAVRGMVRDVNQALQDATVGLVALVFILLQWLIYGFVALVAAKYVWRWGRRIWQGKPVSAPARRAKNGTRGRLSRSAEDDSAAG